MTPINDQRRAAADRMLALRTRGDLDSVAVAFGGQASFVVKDPVAGESFHLSAEEHRLLTALRKPVSLRGLQRIIEAEFAPRQATIPQLQQFVNQLYDQGLLIGEHPGQGAGLLARGHERRRRRRWSSAFQVLAIRLGGFNAGPAIDRLYNAARWLFTPWMLAAALIVVAYAAVLVVGNAGDIAARLPAVGQLVQPSRVPLWILAIAGVKVLHELGHALACRHAGARPQEMGLLLLAGAPALYCDVSDAWRLPSKWRRMSVSAAGMLAELLIASAAAIVWWYAAPGVLSAVCLSLVVVCSVGTLAVNANPLLRYDGYYLLADWLEVPNLAERARGLVSTAWRQWLLGEPPPSDPFVGTGKRRALWAYAILSKAYLALVLGGVFLFAIRLAKPHGLENAVYTLAAVSLLGLLLGPVMALAKLIGNPSVRARLRWRRLGGSFAVLAVLGIVAWSWPMTRRVEAPLVALPANTHPLFAVVGGELTFAAAKGAAVEAGEVVARLANPELDLALAKQQGDVRERRVHLEQLLTLQAVLPAAARMIPTAAAELADSEAQLAQQQALAEQLVIRAPVAGRVFAPPPRPAQRGEADMLRPWSGSPLAVRNVGAWIEPGTPLAVIAAPGGWVAWAAVNQADVPAVEPGQSVRMLVDDRPMSMFEGRVTQVTRRARDNHPASPYGETASPAGRATQDATLLGDDRYHVIEVAFDAKGDGPTDCLFAGVRGTARIATQESTLGALAWMQLRRAFARAF